MRNLRILVHFAADAVSDELFDHSESRPLDFRLHSRRDLGPHPSPTHFDDRRFQHAPSDLQQPLLELVHLADRIRPGGVSAPALHAAAGVDADDVPRFEPPFARNAVHDLIVDRNADAGGKRHDARHPLEQRNRTMPVKQRLDCCIQFALSWMPGAIMPSMS